MTTTTREAIQEAVLEDEDPRLLVRLTNGSDIIGTISVFYEDGFDFIHTNGVGMVKRVMVFWAAVAMVTFL